MKLVILESPYRGKVEENVDYARRAILDSLGRGEAPLASHLLYTQPGLLKDEIKEDRALGLAAGRAWIPHAHAMVVYTDLGFSEGMLNSIAIAKYNNIPVEFRKLGSDGQ